MSTCKEETEAEPEPLLALCSPFVPELRKAPGLRSQGQLLSAGTSPVAAPRKEANRQWWGSQCSPKLPEGEWGGNTKQKLEVD